jgi:hypothetical protein
LVCGTGLGPVSPVVVWLVPVVGLVVPRVEPQPVVPIPVVPGVVPVGLDGVVPVAFRGGVPVGLVGVVPVAVEGVVPTLDPAVPAEPPVDCAIAKPMPPASNAAASGIVRYRSVRIV